MADRWALAQHYEIVSRDLFEARTLFAPAQHGGV
jgi:hypothetical protein